MCRADRRHMKKVGAVMKLELTDHARSRLQQRGFREGDVGLVVTFGTPGRGGRFLLRARDVDAATRDLKRLMADLERPRNSVVLVEDDSVVTVYRSATGRARRPLGPPR